MSRAKAEADRVPLDAYMTPDELALAICAELRRRGEDPMEVIEPSAGEGAFVRAARATWDMAHVTAVEIDPSKRQGLILAGAHTVVTADWARFARDLANTQSEEGVDRLHVGNLPFRQAQEHIEAGMDVLREDDRQAFLLRLNFLGSKERVSFWRRPGLESIQTIAPRPSFGLNKHGKKGSDGTEYALFTWRKGYRGAPRILRPLVWAPPRRRSAA
jgi:hypothetical protein